MPWCLLLSHMQAEDIAFVEQFLRCNPAHRISAAAASQLDYFQQPPLPCVPSLLSFRPREKRKVRSAVRDIKSVDVYLDQVKEMAQDV